MDNSLHKKLSLDAAIEAILFYTAEPMSLRKLAALTKTDVPMVRDAVRVLAGRLEQSGGGVRLIEQENEVALGTAPEASQLIEEITREEISKELSKASLETLSIICYKGPLTRSDIDYIRGVNSTFILRNLLVRGIVERLENPKDARASLYGPTFAALEYMGVTRKEELPQYEEIEAQLAAFANARFSEEGELIAESAETPAGEDMALHDVPLEEGEKNGSAATNFDADIAEEDLMAPAFDDKDIAVHNAEDEHAAE